LTAHTVRLFSTLLELILLPFKKRRRDFKFEIERERREFSDKEATALLGGKEALVVSCVVCKRLAMCPR
jgi:hypothetical protein